ncbi:hypothetical protein AVEN_254431-1 [Araneus ventricosus]|uniref:Uncharacterized protein n=1 Tax=Araneus ventricosus TaxID=182803 RepID=A0A4Y2GK77_ARAVE|nr:hypothetical protein AVEN_254431-1 [Araneus ventricosus]
MSLDERSPRLMKFIVFNISIPVMDVICESWGSTINKIVQKRPTAIDGDDAAVGTTDKRMFAYSNGAPPGHKSVKKLLKVAIVALYGPNFHKHLCKQYFPINVAV